MVVGSLSFAIELFGWGLEFREVVLISCFLWLGGACLVGFSCCVKISKGFCWSRRIRSARSLTFSFAVFSFISAKVRPLLILNCEGIY